MSVPNDHLVDPQVVPSVTKSWRPRHRVLAFVVALMVGAFSAITAASPAQAYTYIGENVIRNWETGLCLDSNWAGDVYTLPCELGTNPHQVWEVYHQSRNSAGVPIVQLKNKATGRCLDTADGSNPVTVSISHCPAYPAAWLPPAYVYETFFYATGEPLYRTQFRSYYSSGYCLDSNRSGDVYSIPCNGGNYQNWRHGY
jgi:serine/threonine-protein kinase